MSYDVQTRRVLLKERWWSSYVVGGGRSKSGSSSKGPQRELLRYLLGYGAEKRGEKFQATPTKQNLGTS